MRILWLRHGMDGEVLQRPAPVATVTTESAEQAYRHVVANAGAWPRDRVTLQVLAELRQGTGSWGRHAPPHPEDEWLLEGLARHAPARDVDGDGIPDAWEQAHGLNPRQPGDQLHRMRSGYPAIEKYLNERAQIVQKAGNH